jgi:D-arginine dehydrogenase
LWIAATGRRARLVELGEESRALVPSVRLVEADEVRRWCPVLRPAFAGAGLLEPDAMEIDVAALHQWYVQGLRARGASIVTGAAVTALRRTDRWSVSTPAALVEADVVVDAAGAWGDAVATLAGVRPLGLRPLRRTAFIATLAPGVDARDWPLVADVDEGFYFKPEGPHLLCSLADETPSPPCDAKPDEADVALALDHINAATTLDLRHVRAAWAGLRTFSPDRVPVVGRDPDVPTFVWLVGQGGFGIQTAPALARACADAALRNVEPVAQLAPARLR